MKKDPLPQIKQAFDTYYELHKKYPTTLEMDESGLFPISVKQMQRIYGGIIPLRAILNLSTTSFASGDERIRRAHHANNRAVIYTKEMYKKLVAMFGEVNVHQEAPLCDDYRYRADFKIYKENRLNLVIDLFYASRLHSLEGCIRIKKRKYENLDISVPIVFVQMNDEVPPIRTYPGYTVITQSGIISLNEISRI